VASPGPVLGLFCHHRCGSTWLSDLLEEFASHCGYRFARVFDSEMFGDDLAAFIAAQGVEVLAYMNADWRHVEPLAGVLGVHVVRDPRDVLVSSYYAHRFSHPTEYWPGLVEHRAQLQAQSLRDGLLAEVQCRRLQFKQMDEWNYSAPHILELRFEDLVEEPVHELRRALGHLGLWADAAGAAAQSEVASPRSGSLGRLARAALGRVRGHDERGRISPNTLEAVLQRHSFEVLSGGRQRGTEDRMHHYRRGSPGEWREVLEPEHLSALSAHFPGLLVRLGYSD